MGETGCVSDMRVTILLSRLNGVCCWVTCSLAV